MTSNEELKRIYNLFTDCWKLYKTYADVQDTDEFWQSVIAESHEISKKYKNSRLCRDLLLASLSELERKEKKLRTGKLQEGKG